MSMIVSSSIGPCELMMNVADVLVMPMGTGPKSKKVELDCRMGCDLLLTLGSLPKHAAIAAAPQTNRPATTRLVPTSPG
jgi:hypothetical protein